MANALNRTTKQYLASINTPDYPALAWIINPDVSAVAGQPTKYWLINGDAVTLMDQAQRDAVDAAELGAARDAVAAALDGVEDIMRAFALVLLDELNAHSTKMVAMLDAIDASTNYATLKTNIAAVTNPPQRSVAQIKTALRNKLGS